MSDEPFYKPDQRQTRPTGWTDIGAQWVVLTGPQAAGALFQQGQTVDTWTPDGSIATEIAPALAAVLQPVFDIRKMQLAAAHVSGRILSATDYFVQCLGIVRDRRRLVYLNGFHRVANRFDTADSWRTLPFLACDGGWLLFRAVYDPETRLVTDLRFNGPVGSNYATRIVTEPR